MQTFRLGNFLNNCIKEYEGYARQRSIEFTPVTDFVFDITLVADKAKIASLLNSALKNTFIYSGASSVTFSVRQLLQAQNTTLLEFSLETNGSIVASAGKFSYFRSLVANRNLIEELNGKSEFVNTPNSGTLFKFVIGLTLAQPGNGPHASGFSCLKGKKILVVDDNETNRTTLADFLEGEGAQAILVPNGRKAIELLEKNNFYDLILLDTLMPQMDGFETAAYIRKKLEDDTAIIAMPASNKSCIPLMCGEVGIDSLLTKPFTPGRLLNLINSTLLPLTNEGDALMKIA